MPVSLQDSTAPAVSLTSPAAGTSVNGTVALSANASDNVGVTKTEFYVDGALAGHRHDGAVLGDVEHEPRPRRAPTPSPRKAYDQANNSTTSAAVSVTKDATDPTVSLTAPSNNASVSGTVPSAPTHPTTSA